MIKRTLVAAMCFLASGCELLSPDDYDCEPFPPSPALFVTVLDSISGEILTDSQVEVTVTDGAFSETRGGGDPGTPGRFSMASGRAGVYRVDVRASGYLDWTTSGVRVELNECGIRSHGLNVRLQKAQRVIP